MTVETKNDRRYLELLSHSFPTIAAASTEIINLEAILNLPKGTEHFLADIHGEHEAFQHVLKNASGNIKRKVNELFGINMRDSEKKELCTLIYYPEQKIELVKQQEPDLNDWYQITLLQLVKVCREVSSKYSRSKVRKSLPADFGYIIEELLHESTDDIDKQAYVSSIITSIISTGRADDFITAICNVIQRLSIDQLHILGDIYDRGPGAHIILDTLRHYHSWDIQWGNHDALWMGACAGNEACICNVLRLSLRYANMATLEDGYGINLLPLATFALETYADDPCTLFRPRLGSKRLLEEREMALIAKMHKAISIIQFKVENQIFHSHPEWGMEHRDLLSHIDLERGTCTIDGQTYEMSDTCLPTIRPEAPNMLTEEEQNMLTQICHSFAVSEKLHKHIRLLLSHGSMFSVCNSNLLFHASIPLQADGTLKPVDVMGKKYSGRDLLHRLGQLMRTAFQTDAPAEEKAYARDYFIYLWCGTDSPLFDKSKMATFERYFVKDPSTHAEQKGHYFLMRNREDIVDSILDAFGVEGTHRHIINGHVPVHAATGESPIKANGKLMVIDGGFSEPYHKETGIAGYTLVYHSRGFQLVQHEPFTSADDAIRLGTDIVSTTQIVEMSTHRQRVRDTDRGRELSQQIDELRQLLHAYRHGIVHEKMNG